MSALPHEMPAYDPHRLRVGEGPQTLAQLRAALADIAPADLTRFDAKLAAARLDEVPAVISEYRHVLALRSRPEVAAAIAASLAGEAGHMISAETLFGESAA
jgi:hypothetical protein